jgi:NADPH-dependent glutamate synthase beta subunit-like oxidoreductase
VISAALASEELDTAVRRKLDYLAELAQKPREDRERIVEFLFYRSPVEIKGSNGAISQIKLEKNAVSGAGGKATAAGTGEFEWLDAQFVFPAVGYRAEPTVGLPFDDARGIIPNKDGRVLGAQSAGTARLYAAGWIKRGPSGVIGTNKLDANDTVNAVLEDLRTHKPAPVDHCAMDTLLQQKNVRVVSFADWQKLDSAERARGEASGKVRDKFTNVQDALAALG